MTASQALYRLQTIDLAIAQRQARLKAIDSALGENAAAIAARQTLDAADKTLKSGQTRARDLELEIKGLGEKINETDQSLYGGKVRNPKALQEMQEELDALRRRQSSLEDTLLEVMVEVESGQADVERAAEALKRAQTEHAGSQTDLTAEREKLNAELVKLAAQRQEEVADIDRTILATYEALRPRKGGRPVSLLQGDSCAACGVEQTALDIQKVQGGKGLVYCNTCGRILAIP